MLSSSVPAAIIEKASRPYAGPRAIDRQWLDVYTTARARDATVIVFVHGGGLTEGDRSWYRSVGTFLTKHRFVAVLPSYRLYPRASVSDAAGDVRDAVLWTHLHIRAFGGDPERIVLVGHSAGGWLVDLVMMDTALWHRTPPYRAPVRAAAYFSGDYADITQPAPNESAHDRAVDEAMMGPPGPGRKHVSPDAYAPANVPWLLVCATNDDPGTCADRDAYATALRRNRIPVVTFTDRGSHMGEVTHLHTEGSRLWTVFDSWVTKVVGP